MFGVKESRSTDQSVNFFNKQIETCEAVNVRSILIADRDRDILDQLSRSFAICAKQYNISTTQNGMEAVNILNTSPVEILLTAHDMPGLNGFNLIDHTSFHYPAVRIFVMSEEDPAAMKSRLHNPGIYGYIKKPFWIETIYSMLRI